MLQRKSISFVLRKNMRQKYRKFGRKFIQIPRQRHERHTLHPPTIDPKVPAVDPTINPIPPYSPHIPHIPNPYPVQCPMSIGDWRLEMIGQTPLPRSAHDVVSHSALPALPPHLTLPRGKTDVACTDGRTGGRVDPTCGTGRQTLAGFLQALPDQRQAQHPDLAPPPARARAGRLSRLVVG